MLATSERLAGREEVIRFQREYPEPWGDLAVLRALGDARAAAVEVEVRAPDGVFRMAAFWDVRDGLLARATEYWVDPGGSRRRAGPRTRPRTDPPGLAARTERPVHGQAVFRTWNISASRPAGRPPRSAVCVIQPRSISSRSSRCPVWLSWARSAAIFRSKASVTST